ncbi:MAG: hypothetical protein K2P48_03310 [Lachnospiraceae bacterium]|nr:hypothetical protein [Lachnospiraceae bacterium]
MSRLHKISIIVFCLGVLLSGIGAGVAFMEFGGYTYGGKYILGEPDMRTDLIDVAFEPEEEALDIFGVIGSYNRRSTRIETDRSVPKNTARFCVTYNAKRVEPFAWLEEEDARIDFGWYWKYTGDEMELMLEAKDVILEKLKEGELVSCDIAEVESVTVLINPANEGDVRIMY